LLLQLGARKRQKVQDAAAAGQRLGHVLHQQKILGPGEDEPPGRRVPVHGRLDVGQEVGHPLGLVDHHRPGEPCQEPPGVLSRERPRVRLLERDVVVTRKGGPGQGRLARLAGSRQRQHRVVFRVAQEVVGQEPGEHLGNLRLNRKMVKRPSAACFLYGVSIHSYAGWAATSGGTAGGIASRVNVSSRCAASG
jgi:hypothetical protein